MPTISKALNASRMTDLLTPNSLESSSSFGSRERDGKSPDFILSVICLYTSEDFLGIFKFSNS
jgi:hypothetical protein